MGKEGQPRAIKVHVAAFGKHPGWDDHIEEIGLDCDALVQVKRALYTEGLAGNIDSGAWEKLSDEHRLPAFRHVFYWRRPDGFVVGRLWSSRDGRGRTKYPMVVVALLEGVSQAWAIEHALPRLEAIESKVAQTSSAELVRLAIGEARRGLEDEAALLVHSDASSSLPGPAALVKALVSSPALSLPTADGQGQGLTRIMYEMERELGAFRSSGGGTRGMGRVEVAPQHLRVPRCLGPKGEGALAWLELLSQDIADSIPALLFEPLDEEFLDIIVGDTNPRSLFCVRASAKGLALTSEVPYTIEPAFRQAAADRQALWAAGKLRVAAPGQSAAAGALQAVGTVGSKRGVLIGAAVGGLAVLVILLYLIFGGSSTKQQGQTKSETTPTDPPKTLASSDDGTKTPEATKPVAGSKLEPAATASGARDVAKDAPKPAPSAPKAEPATRPEPTSYAEGDIRAGWVFDAAAAAIKTKLDRLDAELKIEGKPPEVALRETVVRAEARATKFVKSATITPANRESVQRDMEACEAGLAQVSKETDAKLNEVIARVGAEIKSKAETPTVSTEPMRKAWALGVRGVEASGGYKAAREKIATLTRQLQQTEGRVIAASTVKVPALPDADAGAIDAVLSARREAALQAAADAVLAGDDERIKKAVNEYVAWGEQAQVLLEAAAKLEARIAGGELPSDGPAMPTIGAELQASPVWKDLGGPLGGVLGRINAIAELAQESAPEKLLEAIHQGKADATRLRASEVLGAWLRLAQIGWPQSAADLPLAGKTLATEVRETLARVSDEKARGTLVARADQAARLMWTSFVERKGVDAQSLGAAVAAMSPLGADARDIEGLPSWAQYNLARFRLEQAVEAASAKTGAERADAQALAMDAFAKGVEGLDVSKTGAGAALMAAIQPLRDKGAQLDLSKLGPGSAGWKLTQSPDGMTVTYSWTRGATEHKLDFRRLAEGATGEVSFVGTTEVSVGLFADVVSHATKWDEFKDLISKSSEGGIDPRQGPRGWVWVGELGLGIAPSKPTGPGDTSGGWVRISSTMQQKPCYPDGLVVAPPALNMPMQYVGPAPALFAARLIGCRLPSTGEWKQALTGDGPTPAPNLRDVTWKREVDHIKQFVALSPEWPASRRFFPAGQRPIPAPQDDQPAVTSDDGVLWFRPVDQSTTTTFHDLIGNVAEYVFDDAGVLEGVAPARDKVEAALGKGEKLKVIGGSALSPAGQSNSDPLPVNISQAKLGYSDVGFRLAFSAPRAAGAAGVGERLTTALSGSGYLPAQK